MLPLMNRWTGQYASRCAGLAVVAAAVYLPAPCSAQVIYKMQNDSGYSMLPTAISRCGYVATGTHRYAFQWTGAGIVGGTGVTTSLGLLDPIVNNGSVGWGISDAGGAIVGESPAPPGGVIRAFRWTQAMGMVNLGTFPGGLSSKAFAVSGNGLVVVGESGSGPPNHPRQAFRWTQATGMVSLGSIPGGSASVARGVSGDGSVIAGIAYIGSSARAFRWTQSTGMVDLGMLPGDTRASAMAVSQDGTTIVGASSSGGGFSPASGQGFRWTQAGGMQGLGNIPGECCAEPRSVSADGSVITGNSLAGPYLISNAFIWRSGIGIASLSQYLNGYGLGVTAATQTFGLSPDGGSMTFLGTTVARGGGPYLVRILGCPALPRIVASPWPGTQVVCAWVGGGADSLSTFTVEATDDGPLTYSWQREGVPLTDGPTPWGSVIMGSSTEQLSIRNAGPADDGRYTAVVGNPFGESLSDAAELVVAGPELITNEPSDTTVCPGPNEAVFSVAVAAPPGVPVEYRWQRSVGVGADDFVDIFDGPTGNGGTFAGADTGNLSISGCSVEDFRRYRCRVILCGWLQMSRAVSLVSAAEVSLVSHPQPTSVCANGSAIFSVALASGTAPASFEWQIQTAPPPNDTWETLGEEPGPISCDGGGLGGVTGTAFASPANSPLVSISVRGCAVSPGSAPGTPVRWPIRCIVSTDCGSVTSNSAMLTVCAADFDCNGTIDIVDLFDFLDAWFAQNGTVCVSSCSSDFDGDTDVDVVDLFSFLDAWFAQNGTVCG